jgi:hypothetical protein
VSSPRFNLRTDALPRLVAPSCHSEEVAAAADEESALGGEQEQEADSSLRSE